MFSGVDQKHPIRRSNRHAYEDVYQTDGKAPDGRQPDPDRIDVGSEFNAVCLINKEGEVLG
jgi:hypothetical protein